ncbi:mitochondrial inner membrane protein OXA1L-like [Leptopilina boulardi]|uniref:mitochondrial inner membrane protein OXA1L-like n=1 Tax=Leptopilina boulardi TaxID=63433 RepID=UPI0021F52BF2|nr:mitochondrial inner membrane protein OXA1L-like [Leptopilina boulardi]
MLSRMSFNVAAKNVTKSQYFIKLQNKTTNRSLHLVCQTRILQGSDIFNCKKTNVELNFIRHASNKEINDPFGFIPEAPAPEIINVPVVAENVSELASAGLGNLWTPSGLVQNALELLHSTVGLPWWGSIIALTVVVRLVCFPLIIKAQKKSAQMMEYMPEVRELQNKLSRARQAGDQIAVERYLQELTVKMSGREMEPFKALGPSLAQGLIVCSVFFALRDMAAAPLQSMETGGILWFTNLCVPDPHWLLPLMSCGTLFLLIKNSTKQLPYDEKTMKIMCAVFPIGTFLFIKSFPASVLVYWVTTNTITLLQHYLLNMPQVKSYFNLPDLKKLPKNVNNSDNFLESFRENISNIKLSKQYQERIALQKLEKDRFQMQMTQKGRSKVPQDVRKKKNVDKL